MLRRALLALPLVLAGGPAAASGWTSCLDSSLEPPAPVEREAPPYPESARLANAEGSVEVSFTVLRTGDVGWVRITRAEPSGFFEQAALDGVRAWRFTPAMRAGTPIECRLKTRVRFTLADVATVRAGSANDDGLPSPSYPAAAREARLEGYVELTLTVAPDGHVARTEVTAAMPRGEFERAALTAVKSWRLPPAAEPRELRRRFDFSLPDSPPRPQSASLLAAAPLPSVACQERLSGWVRLEVDADAEGRILAARVVAAEPAGLFDATALAIARRSRIAPAWRDGHPVAATGLLTLAFSPDSSSCPDAGSSDRHSAPRPSPTPRVSGARERGPGSIPPAPPG
ncbi:MAG: energy transducer TonB [Steroidobacteraceae bacterium]|jgi:TonB family protein|nr:energy transducer TonB [Steroidobacteraceae bacterium]